MNTYKINDIIEGTIITIKPFGAIMIFEDGQKGLLHISQVANTFIRNISRYLKIGKTYQKLHFSKMLKFKEFYR